MRRCRRFAPALGAVIAVGCASQDGLDAEVVRLRREMYTLKDDLSQTRSEVDRLNRRLDTLSLAQMTQTGQHQTEPSSPSSASQHPSRSSQAGGPPPSLRVVKLGPSTIPQHGGWVEPGAQDDGSPPVVIRLGPDPSMPSDTLGVDRHVLKKPDPVLSRASASGVVAPRQAVREAYQEALALLREKNQPEAALLRFDQFLVAHPRSHLADNAAYWRGVCWMRLDRHDKAVVAFQKLIAQHPRSAKVPDAKLQIGESWLATGQTGQAKTMLQQVVDLHPKTEAAKEARLRLASLAKG